MNELLAAREDDCVVAEPAVDRHAAPAIHLDDEIVVRAAVDGNVEHAVIVYEIAIVFAVDHDIRREVGDGVNARAAVDCRAIACGEIENVIVPRAAVDVNICRVVFERIVSGAAVNIGVCAAIVDVIVARAAVEQVFECNVDDVIIAVAAFESRVIGAASGVDRIVARTALEDRIFIARGGEEIVAGTAVDRCIRTVVNLDIIIARARINPHVIDGGYDRIIARAAVDCRPAPFAVDRIVAVAADDRRIFAVVFDIIITLARIDVNV